MDFAFIGGSLGSVMGEKIRRAIDYCIENKLPYMIICQSGGARMQEASYSLFQLAKVQSKLAQLSDHKLPYIAYLCDPTFGGITASFAMTADIIMAEPGALIGFAGPRAVSYTHLDVYKRQTDHCAKKLLPWIDGLLDASEEHFKAYGKPLYSSHMLDLSEEPIEENLDISCKYFERMAKMGMTLEIELGVTGGEEDGVDNSNVDSSKLYTQPNEVAYACLLYTSRCV